ncbi:MAG: hypothetical protein ACYTFY_21145, partial [Planctomycetota bacterium]
MSFPFMFDMEKITDLKTESKPRKVMLEATALTHATKDDPPVLLLYKKLPEKEILPASANPSDTVHSARHGLYAEKFLKEKGIAIKLSYPGRKNNPDVMKFIVKSL